MTLWSPGSESATPCPEALLELLGVLRHHIDPVHGGDHSRLLSMGFALVLQILGEVDRGHSTRANLFLDGIAVGKGGLQAVENVWHCVLASLARDSVF